MLLRVYRLTDKTGLLLLKLTTGFSEWLLAGMSTIVETSRLGVGGVLGALWLVVAWLLSAVWALLVVVARAVFAVLRLLAVGVLAVLSLLLRGLRAVANGIFALVRVLSGGASRAAGATAKVSGSAVRSGVRAASGSTQEAMARRAARDEVDVILREDPLRVQNRRLSLLVVVLGVILVGVVLFATDPNRATTPVPGGGGDADAVFLPAETDAPDAPTQASIGIPSPIPTATQVPEALRASGTIAYVVREQGQTDLWAVGVGSRTAIRITNDIADERDPEWNPDGTRLAYASRQDGNWELYIYDLATQASSRVTFDLSFQANPSWSPDSFWLTYENYIGGNLDIYALPVDGSSAPLRITSHPSPDFSPSWSPSGRKIAFVSWRDGNQDIYVIDLDSDLSVVNITNTPLVNEEHPVWSPDGRFLAYSSLEQGTERVFIKAVDDEQAEPEVIGLGRTPSWSPDGNSLVYMVDATDNSRSYLSAIALAGESSVPTQVVGVPYGAASPTWSGQPLPPQQPSAGGLPPAREEPLVQEVMDTFDGEVYRLQSLGNVQTDQPWLSDTVGDSFNALRQAVLDRSGVDFLAQLDDAFWTLERRPEPGEARRSWHMTGRAIALSRNAILGFPPPIEIVREDRDGEVYWRVYLRVDEDQQSGQLGEPLRQMPWDFLSATQGDVEAFNQGGRLRREIPSGYYIDFTQLAADYGWERVPAGSDWRANVYSRNYWLYVNNPNGLSWCEAMLQIHSEGALTNFECTASTASGG